MGLCRGGSCWGMALRVPAARVRRVLGALWKREMLNKVYKPTLIPVLVAPGRRVRALAFVADTTHRQFVRELDLHGRARLVAQGIGLRGPCVDYIRNTLEHMLELGVHDPHLARILDTAMGLCAGEKRK
jgi:cation transport protein ChaC